MIAASDELKAINDKWSTEIICIDDCSTDGSGEILDELLAVYHSSLIVYHSPANAGVSAARNRGLDEATGDYVWFVDADDAIAPESLARIAEIVEKERYPDFVRFRLKRFEDKELSAYLHSSLRREDALKAIRIERAHSEVAFIRHFGVLIGSNAVYQRNLIGVDRFKGFTHGEDALFGFERLLSAQVAIDVDNGFYYCRARAGSAQHSSHSIWRLSNVLGVTEEKIRVIANSNLETAIRKDLLRQATKLLVFDNIAELKGLGTEGLCRWRESFLRVYSNPQYVPRMIAYLTRKLLVRIPIRLLALIILTKGRVKLRLLKSAFVYRLNGALKRRCKR